jgi:hypothetical protein
MTKIDQIEAAAQLTIAAPGKYYANNAVAFHNLCDPAMVLKMCAVIKAAESMGYENTADSRKAFWSTLKELNK